MMYHEGMKKHVVHCFFMFVWILVLTSYCVAESHDHGDHTDEVIPEDIVIYLSNKLPDWKIPKVKNFTPYWKMFLGQHALAPFFVKGDFDGDGQDEIAISYHLTMRYFAQLAIQSINIITDNELRNCIQERLTKNGTIKCETCSDPRRLGYNTWWWFFGWHKSKKIHICTNNASTADIPDTILHEFAHSCCWDHGDGKGVPL